MIRFLFVLILPLLVLLASLPAAAEQAKPDPVVVRMRDAMKKLAQRVTDAETQMVNAQAAQMTAEAQVKELTEKLAAASRQIKELDAEKTANKITADKKLAELEAKVAVRDKDNATLTESLAKWKEGFAKLETAAKTIDGKRAALDSQVVQLQRRVDDRETKNRELFRLGNEILDRYKNFGLGTALTAREPFTGITKVKLQTLVQDYGDKLVDQKVISGKP